MNGSSSEDGFSSLEDVFDDEDLGLLAVCVSGSGSGNFPATMSASQSPRPPGAASTAVCGQ